MKLSKIQEELREVVKTQLNSIDDNIFKSYYWFCLEHHGYVYVNDDVYLIPITAVYSSEDSFKILALNQRMEIVDFPINNKGMIPIFREHDDLIGSFIFDLEENSNPDSTNPYYCLRKLWISIHNGEDDLMIKRLFQEYLKEHPEEYIFTQLYIPNTNFSGIDVYSDNETLPEIYLKRTSDDKDVLEFSISPFNPDLYKLDLEDSNNSDKINLNQFLGLCWSEAGPHIKEIRKIQEKEKYFKYYLLPEEIRSSLVDKICIQRCSNKDCINCPLKDIR